MGKLQRLILILALIALGAGCSQTSSTENIRVDVSQSAVNGDFALKIYTTEEGFYQVGSEDLEAVAINLDQIDPEKISLLHRGIRQSFWVDGQGDEAKIRFYAAPDSSKYQLGNIYWLVSGDVTHLGMDGSIDPPATTDLTSLDGLSKLPGNAYYQDLHLEQNTLYNPQVEQGDHWLWSSLVAPGSTTIPIDLGGVFDGRGRLKLKIWSATEAPDSPDHQLTISFNGLVIKDETWDGHGWRLVEADIPDGLIQEGQNQIQIEAPGKLGVAAELYQVDWLEIVYPRQIGEPEDDRMTWISQGVAQILDNFSGPLDIYYFNTGHEIERVVEGTVPLEFTGMQGHRYWALGPNGYMAPESISKIEPMPDLRTETSGADYIAIGPADLLEPLKPLLDLREQQGLSTWAVPSSTVFDQFAGGYPEPAAIRDFLRHAYSNWQVKPRFVLLVGDASYDPKGYITQPEANRLPTFFIDTVYGGQTSSDLGYAQLDGEIWPPEEINSNVQIAVGRIPARTPAQVEVLVSKVIAYEGSNRSAQSGLLAIADPQDENFRADAQAFLDAFPEDYQKTLFVPVTQEQSINQEVVSRIEQGQLLLAYFGHGSLNMWGKDNLLDVEDVQNLTNREHLPIVLNLTCLTGLFTHPKNESLAEAFLWNPDGGAVSVLAPSSLTLPNDQGFLLNELVQSMLKMPTPTIGEVLQSARGQVSLDSPGRRDVVYTYLLFGDPALRLSLP